MTNLEFRFATAADRTALRTMQANSMRKLGAGYYSAHTIEAFISEIGTMDDYLIDDRTYMIATLGGVMVGSGGWSTRLATYDTCSAKVAKISASPEATVRSVYVDPAWCRRGIGRGIMQRIEAEVLATGFKRAALTATLSGIPLYRHLGYGPREKVTLTIPNGTKFEGLKMMKDICEVGLQNYAA